MRSCALQHFYQLKCKTVSLVMPPPLIGVCIKRCFCLTSVSVAYIGPNSRTERPRKTKIGTEVAHVTHDSDTTFKVKGQGHQAALVGCTGRPTRTYSNGDLSICVHDVYRVTTCRPVRRHIVAAARPPTACYMHVGRVYRSRLRFIYLSYGCNQDSTAYD